MRRIISIGLCLCILSVPLFAEDLYVSGESSAAVVTTFSDADFDIDEHIAPSSDVSFRVESEALSYWSTVELSEDGLSISLDRFSYQLNLSDHFQLTVGRQGLLSGYGYGWNPSDLFSGMKDPSDPESDRNGVDAISLQYDDWNMFTGKLILKLDEDAIGEDMNWSDVSFGTSTTVLLPWMELQLSLMGDIPNKGSIIPSAGLAAYADIAGAGVYGEINTDLDILGGLEYFFENGMSLIAEYLYHQDGFDLSERQTFFTNVVLDPNVALTYIPGFFERHYVLGNLSYSFYEQNTDIILAALYAPDSSSLMFSPAVTVYTDSGITIEAGYVGLIELGENEFSEFGLYPFDHAVSIGCSYAF